MKIIKDIICQVYAGEKSKKTIDLVLNTFIPEYKRLDSDYTCKPDNNSSSFKSEEEMVTYFVENKSLNQTFYWNDNVDNIDRIMVGANITEDDKLIISLTIDGTKETEQKYFNQLKKLLKSQIRIVSYVDPAEYDSGKDFVNKYGKNLTNTHV